MVSVPYFVDEALWIVYDTDAKSVTYRGGNYMDYNKVAKEVISHVGGPKNIKKAFHCATRLRLMLKDPSLADEKALESVDGVKGTFLVQEQFQIIFGNGAVDAKTAVAEVANPVVEAKAA